MVLDAFCVATCRHRADAERQQEGFDELMAGAAALCEVPAELGEEDAAIGTLQYEALIREAPQHLGDRRLRDAEPRRYVHLARLAPIRDQIGDELDIVLHELEPARLPCLTEALDLGFGVDVREGVAAMAPRLLDHPCPSNRAAFGNVPPTS